MKAVLDSCVALKWVLNESDSAAALKLRSEFRNQAHEFLAPNVFSAECCHALLKCERRKQIKIGDATLFLGDILSTSPDLHDFERLMPRAVEIASALRCGFYDCTYVALAERENCELVTADVKMIANLSSHFPFIVPLSSLP